MEHIRSWSMLTLIHWVKTYISYREKEALLGTGRDVCPEVNTEKTKYMVMCHQQNVGINPMKMWQSSGTQEQL
jgi:hypothetical protein